MTYDRIRASRAIWAWRLFRLGELPADVEVIAVRATADRDLADARDAVREMADEDGTPINWLGESTVTAVSENEDLVAVRAKQDALEHGMAEEELPPKLRRL